jgi:hypothetical protein
VDRHGRSGNNAIHSRSTICLNDCTCIQSV